MGHWRGDFSDLETGPAAIGQMLADVGRTVFFVEREGEIAVTSAGEAALYAVSSKPVAAREGDLLAVVPPLPVDRLGDPTFLSDHGLRAAYMGGSMANGIPAAAGDLTVPDLDHNAADTRLSQVLRSNFILGLQNDTQLLRRIFQLTT